MHSTLKTRLVLAASIAAMIPPAYAVDVIKLNNNIALNLGTSWADDAGLGDIVPGAGDIIVWNNTFATPGAITTLSQLGADMSVLGLKVLDVGGARNVNATLVGFQNAVSANTLTIGAGGIDMSTALQALRMQSKIALAADQTWSIANANTNTSPSGGFNNGEDLSFDALLAGADFNLGGFTTTVTGAGAVTITSGFTIRNGTLNVSLPNFTIQGGGNRVTNVASDVTVNIVAGGRVHFQSNSGANGASLASAATINLSGGTLSLASNNATLTLTQSGPINVLAASTLSVRQTNTNAGSTGPINFTGNLTGSAPLTLINEQPTTVANRLIMSGDNSGYSGTATLTGLAGKTTRMSTNTAGSAAATWVINSGHTLELNGVAVDLGTLNGAGTVSGVAGASAVTTGAGLFSGVLSNGTGSLALTKIGNGTLTLTGASNRTGATTVSGGKLLVQAGGGSSLGASPVTVADGATFGVAVSAAGGAITLPSVTIGAATGGSLSFELGAFGNTLNAPIVAPVFNPLAGSRIIISGTGFTIGSAFPLLDYDGAIGGGGFAGLSLIMPPRVLGTLEDNLLETALKLTVTGVDSIKWTGAINGDWDIDGAPGTLNWKEVVSGNSTRYIQTPTGSDAVLFDDTATGATSVVLATALTPLAFTVDTSIHSYTFSGAGSVGGLAGFVKSGTTSVRIANTTANTYTGGTTINAGTVEVGDGVTAGAGSLGAGPILNNGALSINRPDGIILPGIITGTGALQIAGGNLTITNAANVIAGPVSIGAGRTFSVENATTLSGTISGSGTLTKSGVGQLVLSGTGNAYAGGTTVTNGTILAQSSGALGNGIVTISGTSRVLLAPGTSHPNGFTIETNSPGVGLGAIQVNGAVAGNVVISGPVTVNGVSGNGGHIVGAANAGTDFLVFAGPLNFGGATDITVRDGRVEFSGGGTLPVPGGRYLGLTGFGRIGANDGAPVDAVLYLGLSAAGNFDLNGFNQTFALIRRTSAFASSITNSSGTPSVLTINTPATVAAPLPVGQVEGFGGTLTGNLALIKIGVGTQILSATSTATFTGGITVNAGILDNLGIASYPGATTINGGAYRTDTRQTGTSGVNIAGGGTFRVRVAAVGGVFTTGSLQSAANGTVEVDLGTLGNPSIAPINAPALSAGASTTLRILGSPSAGTFPVIAYDNINPIGGAGFAGFALALPFRVAGSLVDNSAAGTVDVNVLGVDTPKWNGNLSSAWDFNDGTGTGTLNWRGSFSATATHYFQNSPSSDAVVFDDTATNGGVTLATTVTPVSISAENETLVYSITGVGKISGATGITKSGAGVFRIANTGINDFTGPITINAGTVEFGDGVTPGAGAIGNVAIANNGTVSVNRPDDFAAANALTGTGALLKKGAGNLTLPAAATLNATSILQGTLTFGNGGAINGILAGTGNLANTAGTLTIGGTDPNTFAGNTTINGGRINLAKPVGIDAIGGGIITIAGTAQLGLMAGEQIADTATVQLLGTSTDSIPAPVGTETVANVIVNSANGGATGGQLIMRNGFTVTNTGTLTRGILGVASGSIANVNRIDITSAPGSDAILRIAAGSAASTLNIGSGGINASGGEIQVKFSITDQDAVINLAGDFIATGNVNITNAGYLGASQNIINLVGDRVFDILSGVTVTAAPDFGGTGSLTKTGDGTLRFAPSVAGSYTGTTGISAGILELNGAISGSAVSINGGTLAGGGTVANAPVLLNALGRISPGTTAAAVGRLTFAADTNFVNISSGVAAAASGALLFDIGDPLFSDRVSIPSGSLNIGSGVLEFDDFVFNLGAAFANGNTYTLIETSQPIAGLLGPGIHGTLGGFNAQINYGDNNTDIVLIIPEPGSAALLLGGLAMLATRRRKFSKH